MKGENKILIKVCGLNKLKNIEAIQKLKPDFIGFIFYNKSKRFFKRELNQNSFILNLNYINKVGVFVNASMEEIMQEIQELNLQFVQLHGEETPAFCKQLQKKVKVIKAFRITNNYDFKLTVPYLDCCDYYLFDCYTPDYGGSGQKFNWHLLKYFPFTKKYFLSGGIKPEDAEEIKNLKLPGLYAVDINSGFEQEPGLKNTAAVKRFLNEIKK